MADNCSSKSDANGSMSETESKLVLACLRNATGGTLTVDAEAIATELGLAKRSVDNRLSALRKKFNVQIRSCKSSNDSGANQTDIPNPPSKNRAAKYKVTGKKSPKSFEKSAKAVADDEIKMDSVEKNSVSRDDEE